MYENTSVIVFYLEFLGLLLAAYLLKIVFPLIMRRESGSFSRILNAMFFTTILFCLLQVLDIFNIISEDWLPIVSSLLSLLLMLVLIFAVKQIERGILAHDHLARRKFK